MSKNKKISITAAAIAVVIAGVLGAYFVPVQSIVTIIPTTQEEQEKYDALGVAQRFILTSPTFSFDGDINTLKTEYVGSTKSIPPEHMFKATFESAHGGFGNRDGQMLTEAITPHIVEIIISEGKVISAVTDDVWDELNHQYVLKPKLPSHDEPISPFDGIVTDYASLVNGIKSRGILVEQKEKLDDSPFFVPTVVLSVGGTDIQVYEFESESDAKAAMQTISEDGTQIGTSIIRWIDVPHFYASNKIIVLYVGQNPEITSLLESLLGPQFAGM
ncbi:hypothetical protein [Candidatus Nitrosotenuis uzonensis]|uniref:Uncharacterized protein n=1 Tax=Candidatus Nitrosotenuis uzonensis TaxID=1407055 RepID=A0A812F329_9ARCH|nr:hypothetical protein [Candidatus Nitrosotenuis uzonensis]CAE6493362.1 conserved hypothetical protein [Candidatus Nitrosotenuis uzonensis]